MHKGIFDFLAFSPLNYFKKRVIKGEKMKHREKKGRNLLFRFIEPVIYVFLKYKYVHEEITTTATTTTTAWRTCYLLQSSSDSTIQSTVTILPCSDCGDLAHQPSGPGDDGDVSGAVQSTHTHRLVRPPTAPREVHTALGTWRWGWGWVCE